MIKVEWNQSPWFHKDHLVSVSKIFEQIINVHIALGELQELVEKYRQRTYDEDLAFIEKDLGGIESLASKLKSDVANGILKVTKEDLEE